MNIAMWTPKLGLLIVNVFVLGTLEFIQVTIVLYLKFLEIDCTSYTLKLASEISFHSFLFIYL